MTSTRRDLPPPFGGDDADRPLDSARAVVVPVPYEGTVSYGTGAGRGPDAILRASEQIELYDEELGFEPCRVGIHTTAPLAVCDDDRPVAEAFAHASRQRQRIPAALGEHGHEVEAPLSGRQIHDPRTIAVQSVGANVSHNTNDLRVGPER